MNKKDQINSVLTQALVNLILSGKNEKKSCQILGIRYKDFQEKYKKDILFKEKIDKAKLESKLYKDEVLKATLKKRIGDIVMNKEKKKTIIEETIYDKNNRQEFKKVTIKEEDYGVTKWLAEKLLYSMPELEAISVLAENGWLETMKVAEVAEAIEQLDDKIRNILLENKKEVKYLPRENNEQLPELIENLEGSERVD